MELFSNNYALIKRKATVIEIAKGTKHSLNSAQLGPVWFLRRVKFSSVYLIQPKKLDMNERWNNKLQ